MHMEQNISSPFVTVRNADGVMTKKDSKLHNRNQFIPQSMLTAKHDGKDDNVFS
jgi:hypothetical protein